MDHESFEVDMRKILYLAKNKVFKICNNTYPASQNYVLQVLNKYSLEHKDVYQKDLEKVLKIKRSTATELLKSMEKNDLINKKSVKDDKRLKKIVLTSKGKSLAIDVSCAIASVKKKITKGITKEEMVSFNQVLQKIKTNLCEEGEDNNA